MQRIAVRGFLSLLLLLSSTAAGLSQDKFTPDEVVKSYQGYLTSIRNISFRSLCDDRLAEEAEFNNPRSDDWKIDLVGRRFWCGTALLDGNAGEPVDKQDDDDSSTYSEVLTTPDRLISLSADPKTMQAVTVFSSLEVPADAWGNFGDLPLPLGYCDLGIASKPIPDLLGNVFVKQGDESQVILSSKTADCKLTLWLAPSKGWMPERIVYVRLAPVTDGYQYAHLTYTVTKSIRVGDIWFPDHYRLDYSNAGGQHRLPPGMVVEDGVTTIVEGAEGSLEDVAKSDVVAQVVLSEIKLNWLSDDDFHLQATIPARLDISMEEARAKDLVPVDGEFFERPKGPPLFKSFYGKCPPELSITDARGVPKTAKLADFRGRWVLLDFWGLTCEPCITKSLPNLAKFYEEHAADRDRFEILAICHNWNDDVTTMKEFDLLAAPIVKEYWGGQPLPFPVLIDGAEKTFNAYGIDQVPATLLIDPDGNLVKDGDEELLAEKLKSAKP